MEADITIPMKSEDGLHPINFVARMTGLSTHVIRIWERRYGVVKPARIESGHRRYSDRDIDRLRLLHRAVQHNYPIGEIAAYTDNQLRKLILEAETRIEQGSNEADPPGGERAQILSQCRDAVQTLNRTRLDQTLVLAGLTLPPAELIDSIVYPLMVWVGEQWHEGRMRIAHEHLATAAVRGFLENLRRPHRTGAASRRILLTTPAGSRHDIGALCLAIVAAEDGWQEFFFGPDMPAPEIAQAARDTNSQAVALSVVMHENDEVLREELSTLRQLTSPETAIIVGGPGVMGLRDYVNRAGITYAADLAGFRRCLRNLPSPREESGNRQLSDPGQ